MLTVTESAKGQLAEIIQKNDLPDEASIRLVTSDEGIGLAPDAPRADDRKVEHGGQTVLLIDPKLDEALADKSLTTQTVNGEEQLSLGTADDA